MQTRFSQLSVLAFFLGSVVGCGANTTHPPDDSRGSVPTSRSTQPDIEIGFDDFVGPSTEQCATRFEGDTPVIETDAGGRPIILVCRVPASSPLDFGNVAWGLRATAQLTVYNRAACQPPDSSTDACGTCAVVLAPNPSGFNVGLGFVDGTNSDGRFGVSGPLVVQQLNPACDATGHQVLTATFDAPNVDGAFAAEILLESNDPDEPAIVIPVVAIASNLPVALAALRAADATNPTAPFTDPSTLAPSDRVYFDGRASYDPGGLPIINYAWEVQAPSGSDPSTYAVQTEGPFFSFVAALPGDYRVGLTVANSVGAYSAATPGSFVDFVVIPRAAIHVQLLWDNADNDQDLYVAVPGAQVCDAANPSRDIDDTNGLGPENVTINTNGDAPSAGDYTLYVHNYSNHGAGTWATHETVRVYVRGILRAEYSRTLDEHDLWTVAAIHVDDAGAITLHNVAADISGQTGSVEAGFTGCSSP